MRRLIHASAGALVIASSPALAQSPNPPDPVLNLNNSSVTSGATTQTLPAWMTYLSGSPTIGLNNSNVTANGTTWSLSTLLGTLWSDRAIGIIPDDYKLPTDGTDDGASITRAIAAACGGGGGVLRFLPRTYNFVTGVTDSACPILFQGVPPNEIASGGGTWFSTSNTGVSMLTLSTAAARGSEVRDIGFTEAQPAAGVGWTPTVYPPVINVSNVGGRVGIRHIMFSPVYAGISATGSGRLELDDIRGQPLSQGIFVDQSYDVDHFGPIHFWCYWSSDPSVLGWTQANGDGLLLGRVDGLTAPDVFVYGYRSAIRFAVSSYGSATRISLGKVYADATKYGVWVQSGNDSSQLFASLYIASLTSDGELLGAGGGAAAPMPVSAALLIDAGARADVTIDHLDTQYHNTSPIQINSSLAFSVLRIGMMNLVYYNIANNGSPAISVTASSTATYPHDVALSFVPNLIPTYASYPYAIAEMINGGTDTLFSWPGYQSSALLFTPATASGGVTYATPNYIRGILVAPVAAGTVPGDVWQLPPNPRDGQVAWFECSQTMTGLSVVPSPSGAIYQVDGQPPSSLPGHTPVSYRFTLLTQLWEMGGQ